MPTVLAEFVQGIQSDSTILLFGAGSSLPSNAPSVEMIIEHLSKRFGQNREGFNLSEITDLIEQKTKDRRRMIIEVQRLFSRVKPTGGLQHLPLYAWKSIYTTNYDTLIEQVYRKRHAALTVYSSNFDFNVGPRPTNTRLFKLHGTIDQDVSLGNTARLILTGNDYNYTHEYRQFLFNTLKADLAESKLIIIGHSLSDPDIKEVISQAISLNTQAMSAGRIALLMYQRDTDRAVLYEGKGLEVVFGGIDEFFAELGKKSPGPLFDYKVPDDHLERHPALVPTTIDVAHQVDTGRDDVSKMFNGWPATYSDIEAKLTFGRTVSDGIADYFKSTDGICYILLGASGVGKTTAARQAVLKLRQQGYQCWEHKGDQTVLTKDWADLARSLRNDGKTGILFIDDAHSHLHEINDLIDLLAREKLISLNLLIVSSRNNWRPRVKTPNLFKLGKQFYLSALDGEEIDRLIGLVDGNPSIARLIENTFAGFSRVEKRRRLVERCESDMFVCMRNIFATENFDDIILREYAELKDEHKGIYRTVAALETFGVHVHRQLVIRLLRINMTTVMATLENLADIITEYTIDEKMHVYGWKGRHPVINGIITKYKFNDLESTIKLLDRVIDEILPTYPVEIRSIIELCNIETGVARIPDKKIQNRLLRRMISIAPGVRVPRHRLIRNLIEIGEFDQAQTEIRIFEKDFKRDGPVARYKITLMVSRATRTPGILPEDRLAILEEARELAVATIRRYAHTAAVFGAYCEVGLETFRLSGRSDVLDDAMAQLRDAENRLGDPDITYMIRRFERQIASQALARAPEDEEIIAPEIE